MRTATVPGARARDLGVRRLSYAASHVEDDRSVAGGSGVSQARYNRTCPCAESSQREAASLAHHSRGPQSEVRNRRGSHVRTCRRCRSNLRFHRKPHTPRPVPRSGLRGAHSRRRCAPGVHLPHAASARWKCRSRRYAGNGCLCSDLAELDLHGAFVGICEHTERPHPVGSCNRVIDPIDVEITEVAAAFQPFSPQKTVQLFEGGELALISTSIQKMGE